MAIKATIDDDHSPKEKIIPRLTLEMAEQYETIEKHLWALEK